MNELDLAALKKAATAIGRLHHKDNGEHTHCWEHASYQPVPCDSRILVDGVLALITHFETLRAEIERVVAVAVRTQEHLDLARAEYKQATDRAALWERRFQWALGSEQEHDQREALLEQAIDRAERAEAALAALAQDGAS